LVNNPKDPINAAVRMTASMVGIDMSNLESRSQELLRKGTALEPQHFWTHFWLGWVLLSAKDLTGAEAVFTTCISIRPDSALAYAQRGRALAYQFLDKNNPFSKDELKRRSLADLDRATHMEPTDYLITFARLDVLACFQLYDQIIREAATILEMTPPHYYHTERQRWGRDNTLNALHFFLNGLHKTRADKEAIASLQAWVLLRMNFLKEAVQAANEALKIPQHQPEATAIHARALMVTGTCHLFAKDWEKALPDFEKALALSPASFHGLWGKARSLEELGKLESALKIFQSLMPLAQVDWQKVEVLTGRARILERLGKTKEAEEFWKQAREIDRDFAKIQEKK
jgi:tetratricopeptide (TPR) repeat protein